MDPATAPNINILSFKNQEQTSLGRFLTWSLRYGRIIIIVTEFLVIAAFISRFYFDRELADLHDQIGQKVATITGNLGFEKQFLAFQKDTNDVGGLLDSRKNFAALLAGIAKAKPVGIELRDTLVKDQTITFTCSVVSPQVLNDFLQNLTGSGKFSDISIDDISSKDTTLIMTVSATLTPAAFQ